LQLLKEDINSVITADEKLKVWDAGCGFAQFSQWLAEQGHEITACDVSVKMLDKAKFKFAEKNLEADFQQMAFQEMAG